MGACKGPMGGIQGAVRRLCRAYGGLLGNRGAHRDI